MRVDSTVVFHLCAVVETGHSTGSLRCPDTHSQSKIPRETCGGGLRVHRFRSLHIWVGPFSQRYSVPSHVCATRLSLLHGQLLKPRRLFPPGTQQQQHIGTWCWTWESLQQARIPILLFLDATIPFAQTNRQKIKQLYVDIQGGIKGAQAGKQMLDDSQVPLEIQDGDLSPLPSFTRWNPFCCQRYKRLITQLWEHQRCAKLYITELPSHKEECVQSGLHPI